MATTSKALTLVLVIFCFLVVHELESFSGHPMTADAQEINCGKKCKYRCAGTAAMHKPCMRACVSCCEQCHCVPPPPGRSGEDPCHCYNRITVPGGTQKCP